ncbi:hypothetical protein [Pseudonocardia sp. Ae505_Ps2]|uniref:hypothetical protein n=1 Tax=Pseudonocardia sp. Ae505_Ps2 TaxID=1885034 RepID=UPI000966CC2E|nr:hypothetical protein [Pseudonocardia sp. Ae505_Ps2]OLM08424.1 hypothetical protein Ae505Ps2_6130c [Pseudonocardia sp. Ae505_Ps2]
MSAEKRIAARMGPGDVVVAVSQKFPLPGKNLVAISRVVGNHLERARRRGQIVDSYAGPDHDRVTGRPLDPGETGGDVLVVRVQVIATSINPGLQGGIAALRAGISAAIAALPDQFDPAQAADLLASVAGDAMSVSWADRDELRLRAELFS